LEDQANNTNNPIFLKDIDRLLTNLAKYSDHKIIQKILEESFQSEGTIDE
jgi:hypothetical protein